MPECQQKVVSTPRPSIVPLAPRESDAARPKLVPRDSSNGLALGVPVVLADADCGESQSNFFPARFSRDCSALTCESLICEGYFRGAHDGFARSKMQLRDEATKAGLR